MVLRDLQTGAPTSRQTRPGSEQVRSDATDPSHLSQRKTNTRMRWRDDLSACLSERTPQGVATRCKKRKSQRRRSHHPHQNHAHSSPPNQEKTTAKVLPFPNVEAHTHLDHLWGQVVQRAAQRVAPRVGRVDAPPEVGKLQPPRRPDQQVLGLRDRKPPIFCATTSGRSGNGGETRRCRREKSDEGSTKKHRASFTRPDASTTSHCGRVRTTQGKTNPGMCPGPHPYHMRAIDAKRERESERLDPKDKTSVKTNPRKKRLARRCSHANKPIHTHTLRSRWITFFLWQWASACATSSTYRAPFGSLKRPFWSVLYSSPPGANSRIR